MAESLQILCPACKTMNRVPLARPATAARCGNCHAPL
ncbi:MAG TPA: hypothetical protein VFN42_10845, partial [Acetobacteraceae bacterium]|nr:hypothetical protein [Acetobacteraceae bacterium]